MSEKCRSENYRVSGVVVAGLCLLLLSAGCVTQGDFLRLEEDVASMKRTGRTGADPFARIAHPPLVPRTDEGCPLLPITASKRVSSSARPSNNGRDVPKARTKAP